MFLMKNKLEKINDNFWKLPKSVREGMRVDAIIVANEQTLKQIEPEAIEQLTNVAMLPGIIEPVLAMPDCHWGYGLPMGAVGAFDAKDGVISAGMTGFDINCGVNLITTNLDEKTVRQKMPQLIDEVFKRIPCGLGGKTIINLDNEELKEVLVKGSKWAVEKGYGVSTDLEHTEENGCMEGADPGKVSGEAMKRGKQQQGSLGSGNHYLEIQVVAEIFDKEFADRYNIKKGNIVVMVHCGSRGLGHQIATDYLQSMAKAAEKYKIYLPDKQLVCAPINSTEGQDYFSAMKCAVNYAFANRQVIMHRVRESFESIFGKKWQELGMDMVYGVAHNICKKETHMVNGVKKEVYVHRKGATRCFPGQPVLIGGSMGTSSWLLKGTETAMTLTFGSTAHGAGRLMSRNSAMKAASGSEVKRKMEAMGKIVKAANIKVLAEEAPEAYKDVNAIIETLHNAGISLKVAKLIPLGVIKG